MNQPQFAHPTLKRRARRVARAPESFTAARVTVAWTPSSHDSVTRLAPTEVELVAELEGTLRRTWTWPESFGSNWIEAISPAHCSEVVLTARLGSDLLAQHLVLELAELLTFKLTERRALIRVLFLPTAPTASAPRGLRGHHA